jgi:hypothetical protein
MQFLKKNYEKILLGLVLLGLVAAAAFLPFVVMTEKQKLSDARLTITKRPVRPLEPLDLNRFESAIRQTDGSLPLDFATTNRVLNPVRWLRGPNGPVRILPGSELEKLEVIKITPLYLSIGLENVNVSDSGARYVVVVERQAAAKPGQRGRRPYYLSPGDKNDVFTLREVRGPQDAPAALLFELADSGETISIAKDKPFKRVDGYTVDLRYTPESRSYNGRRLGDKIVAGGEEYKIVAITQNEVVLSAPNGKKYTRPYNATP